MGGCIANNRRGDLQFSILQIFVTKNGDLNEMILVNAGRPKTK